MAKKLAAHVSLWDDKGQLVQLRPGDEVPGWAKDRLGDHVYEEVSEDDPDKDPYEERDDLNPEGGNDLTPSANIDLLGDPEATPLATPTEDAEGNRKTDEDSKATTKSEAKGAGAPDFTGKASARNTRGKK